MSAALSHVRPGSGYETTAGRRRGAMIRDTEGYLAEHLHDRVPWPRRGDTGTCSPMATRKPGPTHGPNPPGPVDSGRHPPEPAMLVEVQPDDQGGVSGESLEAIRRQLTEAKRDPEQRDVVLDVSLVQSLSGPFVLTLLGFAWQLRLKRREAVLFGVPQGGSAAMALLAFPGNIYFRLQPGEVIRFLDQRLPSPR